MCRHSSSALRERTRRSENNNKTIDNRLVQRVKQTIQLRLDAVFKNQGREGIENYAEGAEIQLLNQ